MEKAGAGKDVAETFKEHVKIRHRMTSLVLVLSPKNLREVVGAWLAIAHALIKICETSVMRRYGTPDSCLKHSHRSFKQAPTSVR